jgi:RNA polymerase sigma-70 factor (ECF subfamily)
LGSALAALSLEQRSVVMMHDAEGYKLVEIHRITGVPVGTLKSRLHRARARLRELMEEMEPSDAERRVSGVERN